MAVHLIDARNQRAFELGAGLEILLCYPAWTAQRRAKLADARCRQMVHEWMTLEPARKKEIAERFPKYMSADPRVSLNTFTERLKHAQYTGYIFLPLLKFAETGELPILNGEHIKLSRNAIVEWVWPPTEGGNEIEYRERIHNILKRRLRPWDSVVHLASAFAYVAKVHAREAEASPYDPQDLEFHRAIVVRAQRYAEHIRTMPELQAVARKLIDIEWRE